MRIGLFGFPRTGKSSLFSLLTGATAAAAGGRDAVQLGIAKVPDPRLDALSAIKSVPMNPYPPGRRLTRRWVRMSYGSSLTLPR